MTDTNQEQEATTVPEEQVASPYDELLASITNEEGKPKYRNVEDALRGNQHAQEHIRNLENDNRKVKEEYNRMEELVRQLSEKEEQAKTNESAATPAESESPQPDASLNFDTMYEQFKQRMSAEEQQKRAEANKQKALESVQAKYADKSADFLKEKAAELSVSTDFLLDMAATSPTAFNKALGLDGTSKPSTSWNSSVNTSTFDGQPDNKYQGKNPAISGRSKDAQALWDSL